MGKTLLHDVMHHAKAKYEVVAALGIAFATELSPAGWRTLKGNKANNSWRLYNADTGAIWFFTGYDAGSTVVVRNSYHWAKVTEHFALRSRTDVLRFVRHIQP